MDYSLDRASEDNVLLHRLHFYKRIQKEGEPFDSFLEDILNLISRCEFKSFEDEMLRDKIVYGVISRSLQEILLQETNLSLEEAISICQSFEKCNSIRWGGNDEDDLDDLGLRLGLLGSSSWSTMEDKFAQYRCAYCLYSSPFRLGIKRHIYSEHIQNIQDSKINEGHIPLQKDGAAPQDRFEWKIERKTRRLYCCAHCRFSSSSRFKIKCHINSKHKPNKFQKNMKNEDRNSEQATVFPKKLQKNDHAQNVQSNEVGSFVDNSINCDKILKEYCCTMCNFKSFTRRSVSLHNDVVHCSIQHLCNVCSFKCTDLKSFEIHFMTKHLTEIFACTYCDYKSSRKQSLMIHINSNHINERSYSCELCKFSSSYPSSLARHILATHESIKSHPCPHCNYRTSYKSHLRKHIMRRHTKEKPLKCEKCSKRFVSTFELKRHSQAKHLFI